MIQYTLSLISISQQTLAIEMRIPAVQDTIECTLPAWIPGSYMIRDFARNIGDVTVTDEQGIALPWRKTDKQTWQIETNSKACIIKYVVVANDYSVRGAYISEDYVFLNGTSAFLQLSGYPDMHYQVTLDVASADADWKTYTSLPRDTESMKFAATDYATLIDHPILWGRAQSSSFNVKGTQFSVVFNGEQPIDVDRIATDLIPICEHHFELFDSASPVDEYMFITLLADQGFGGLEHRHSTVLMYPRFDLPLVGDTSPASDTYIDFLSLCSHEFFHTWHVKRLRPRVMLQPDLSKETYTPQLWIYEGFTSFYDDLAVARAGKMSPDHYLTVLSRHLTRLYHTPGRHKQSVAESSFDAWTRFYKQDASSANHIVSYYTKGGIIALGLDILLRQRSDGDVSLDDVMRWLWKEAGANETGTADDIISVCCNEMGINVDDYLDDVVYRMEDISLENLLPHIGLSISFRNRINTADKGGSAAQAPIDKDVGMALTSNSMGCRVTQVLESSAAAQAGLQVGDTLIAADNWMATESVFYKILASKSMQETMQLHVSRQGKLLSLDFPVTPAKLRTAQVEILDKSVYYSWLGVSPETEV